MRDFFMHTYDLLMKGGAATAGFLYGVIQGESRSAVLLVAVMAADYLSGVVAAALGKSSKSSHGKLSSAAGMKGLLKKAIILLVVALSCVLDWFINEGNAMFATAAIWFYISNEALSLLENLAKCGVPIPRKLRDMLEKLSDEDGEDEKDSAGEAEGAVPGDSKTVGTANGGSAGQNG